MITAAIRAALLNGRSVRQAAKATEASVGAIAAVRKDTRRSGLALENLLSENRTCKLVLTMADKDAQPTRFAIPVGESASHELAEGKSLEFTCQADAQQMTITAQPTVAAN